MAAAVRAISILVNAAMIVFALIIVIGVAARAIRLIRGRLPDDDLVVGLMASRAIKVTAMVKWLVGQRRMHKRIGFPLDWRVASVAVLRRSEMPRVLTGRDHAVVTG